MVLTAKELNDAEGMKHGWGIILIRREELKKFLHDLFLVKRHLDILDVGCYKGMLKGWIEENFPPDKFSWEYVGVDIVEPPDRRPDYKHYVMNAQALEFPPASFDAVVMIETLEHVPDYVRAIEEAYRVLRPKGGIFIQSPRCDNPCALEDPTHFHVLHPATLARVMGWVGFDDVKCFDGPTFACWGFKV